jgi:hypothetical protein
MIIFDGMKTKVYKLCRVENRKSLSFEKFLNVSPVKNECRKLQLVGLEENYPSSSPNVAQKSEKKNSRKCYVKRQWTNIVVYFAEGSPNMSK